MLQYSMVEIKIVMIYTSFFMSKTRGLEPENLQYNRLWDTYQNIRLGSQKPRGKYI
jgi:hypothetical protein